MLRPAVFAASFVLLAAAASPAAAIYCHGSHPGAPFGGRIEFGFSTGTMGSRSIDSQQQQLEFYRLELRRRGVDTDRVEFWSGCLRAYVRGPSGGTRFEFYDPATLRQLFP